MILVKHAQPDIDPGQPPSRWQLSPAGRRACPALATALQPHAASRVYSGLEPKAFETARLVAAALGLPHAGFFSLHEHARQHAPYFATNAQFDAAVRDFFALPEQLVYGEETAAAALTRFEAGVRHLLDQHPHETLILVSHGTVISLLAARYNPALEVFPFWKRLGLPAVVRLSLPDLHLLEVSEQIA